MEANFDPTSGDQGPVTYEQLVALQESYRKDLAELRAQLEEAKQPVPASSTEQADPATLLQNRLNELAAHEFYCPGCGLTYDYPQRCKGTNEKPHPAIEVVSTKEVQDRPDPNADPEGYQAWASQHTAPVYVKD